MGSYEKQRIALRYWLQGAGYHRALQAMALAEGYHTGTRKDGETPEFAHQVAIASHLRTLHGHLRHPEETIAAAFLHDIREDYDLADQEIRSQFGDLVADAVAAMTKTFRGARREEAEVFDTISRDPIAACVKLCDRAHNLQSMLGVFSSAKMREYIEETERCFFPMVKRARVSFPDEEPALENLKLMLSSQVELLRALVDELGEC